VLHLFFKGLDDGTAQSLRLSTPGTVGERAGCGGGCGGVSPDDNALIAVTGSGSGEGSAGGMRRQQGYGTGSGNGYGSVIDIGQADDWYGWIPGDDEADALNLQNLEFLYRFL